MTEENAYIERIYDLEKARCGMTLSNCPVSLNIKRDSNFYDMQASIENFILKQAVDNCKVTTENKNDLLAKTLKLYCSVMTNYAFETEDLFPSVKVTPISPREYYSVLKERTIVNTKEALTNFLEDYVGSDPAFFKVELIREKLSNQQMIAQQKCSTLKQKQQALKRKKPVVCYWGLSLNKNKSASLYTLKTGNNNVKNEKNKIKFGVGNQKVLVKQYLALKTFLATLKPKDLKLVLGRNKGNLFLRNFRFVFNSQVKSSEKKDLNAGIKAYLSAAEAIHETPIKNEIDRKKLKEQIETFFYLYLIPNGGKRRNSLKEFLITEHIFTLFKDWVSTIGHFVDYHRGAVRAQDNQKRATVFETKKNISFQNQNTAVMLENSLSSYVKKIELDNDLDAYDLLDQSQLLKEAFKNLPKTKNAGQLTLRFRKLRRQKANGLYAPGIDTMVLEFRNENSDNHSRAWGLNAFIHEYGHYLDNYYSDNVISLTQDFSEILDLADKYIEGSNLKKTGHGKDYLKEPSEVFARAFEVYCMLKGMDNSLIAPAESYKEEEIPEKDRVAYKPFLENPLRSKIILFFEKLFPDFDPAQVGKENDNNRKEIV